MNDNNIQPGNLVKLISGGPVMTVDGTDAGSSSRVVCVWFTDGLVHSASFDVRTLTEAKASSGPSVTII